MRIIDSFNWGDHGSFLPFYDHWGLVERVEAIVPPGREMVHRIDADPSQHGFLRRDPCRRQRLQLGKRFRIIRGNSRAVERGGDDPGGEPTRRYIGRFTYPLHVRGVRIKRFVTRSAIDRSPPLRLQPFAKMDMWSPGAMRRTVPRVSMCKAWCCFFDRLGFVGPVNWIIRFFIFDDVVDIVLRCFKVADVAVTQRSTT